MTNTTEYKFDLTKFTIMEYREMATTAMSDSAGNETLAKAAGLTLEQVQGLSFKEYKRLLKAFFAACNNPDLNPEETEGANKG